jgi:phosphate transport system substrate-binding protein
MSHSLLNSIWISLAVAALTNAGCQTQPDATGGAPAPPPILAPSSEHSPDAPKILPAAPELGLTIQNYPKVDGATSAEPLLILIACEVLGASYEWIYDESDDSRRLYASWVMAMTDGGSPNKELCEQINRVVKSHGTGEAYGNLINKNADLIIAARLPSDDELTLALSLGVQLDTRPGAFDAFIFLLNSKNPVTSLSAAQIRDIYSGRIVNWREVGGPDAAIQPYQRTRNSGSQELMQTLVMRERAMVRAPDLLTGAIMSFPFLAVGKDVHGIGYSVYYYHAYMSPKSDIKACPIDGVPPTSGNIRSRRYPLVTPVYIVTRCDLPADRPAGKLRDWILGPAGQAIVEESGYVAAGELSKVRQR